MFSLKIADREAVFQSVCLPPLPPPPSHLSFCLLWMKILRKQLYVVGFLPFGQMIKWDRFGPMMDVVFSEDTWPFKNLYEGSHSLSLGLVGVDCRQQRGEPWQNGRPMIAASALFCVVSVPNWFYPSINLAWCNNPKSRNTCTFKVRNVFKTD